MYTYVFQENERNDRNVQDVIFYRLFIILEGIVVRKFSFLLFFPSHPTYPYATICIHKSMLFRKKNTTLINKKTN